MYYLCKTVLELIRYMKTVHSIKSAIVKQFIAHTEDYGQVRYIPIILQYYEILQYHWGFKTSVYGTLAKAVLRSMLGICCNKTYGTMTKYDNKDDDRYNDRNKDRNKQRQCRCHFRIQWSDLRFDQNVSVSRRRVGQQR